MLRGTKRALVSAPDTAAPNNKKVDLALMARIHNRWDVEVVDAETGDVKQRARSFNVICNGWWTYVPINGSPGYLQYGRGTGTPAATDTKLFDRISYLSTNAAWDQSTIAQGFISLQYSGQLAPAVAVGETITELGFSYNMNGTGLETHAMLEDMNGNPVSITKTATDIVNIYATVFLHITTDRYANGKIRLMRNIQWMMGFGLGTSDGYGVRLMQSAYADPSDAVNRTGATYTENTRTTSMTFGQFSAQSGNWNGGGLCLAYGYVTSYYTDYRNGYLLLFPATNSQIIGEAAGTGDGSTKNFKTKFAFPTNATVYVDGVAQTSGVTVVADHPSLAESLHLFMLPIQTVIEPDNLVLFFDFVKYTSWITFQAGEERMFERMVDGLAITALKLEGATASTAEIYVSDDLETWTLVSSTVTNYWFDIPSAYAGSKYWKIKNLSSSNTFYLRGGKNTDLNGYAIRFDAAPANGAVITIDYETPMIPKDENHLMDVSMTVTFGEYTGEET